MYPTTYSKIQKMNVHVVTYANDVRHQLTALNQRVMTLNLNR